MVNNHLAKGFYIIEKGTKQNIMLPDYFKLRINLIDKLDAYFVMAKNEAISALANTIKQLHIVKYMHMIYKQDLYNDKQKEIDENLLNTLLPSWKILVILS